VDANQLIFMLVSYFLVGISLTLLIKSSVYYEDKYKAWIPIVNHYTFCKVISEKNSLSLDRSILIAYSVAGGSLLVALLAMGSILGILLIIVFAISLIITSIILWIATYYLVRNVIPYAKSILIIAIILQLASYFFPILNLVQPVLILASSFLFYQKYKNEPKQIPIEEDEGYYKY